MIKGQIWQMEKQALRDLCTTVAHYGADPQEMEQEAAAGEDPGYDQWNDWAIIEAHGVLMPRVPDILGLFGKRATGLQKMRRQVMQARQDTSVNGIFLDVSSPGGSVEGLQQAANEIWRARQSGMAVEAHIEDLGASAALYLASQAENVVANEGARVGSIGTYMVRYDMSEMAEEQGIDVKVISSGELKGAGEPGTEITDEQIQHWQDIVDGYTEQFVEAVARGRNQPVDNVWNLATGRVWLAEGAMDNRLIDDISDYPGGDGGMGHAKQKAQARAGIKAQEESWSAIPFSQHKDHPKADKGAEWDGDAAMDAADDDEYTNIVMAKRGEGTDRGDVKLPSHRGNSPYELVYSALTAVAGVLNGARGGADLPEDVQDTIYNGHMTDEYDRFDEEPPPRELTEEEFKAYAFAGKLIPPKEDGSMGDSEEDVELSEEQKRIVAREYLQDNPDAAQDIVPEEAQQEIASEDLANYRQKMNAFLQITGEEPAAIEALKKGKTKETLYKEMLQQEREQRQKTEEKVEQMEEGVFGGVEEPGGAPQDDEGDTATEPGGQGETTRQDAEQRIEEYQAEHDCSRGEAVAGLSKSESEVVEALRG